MNILTKLRNLLFSTSNKDLAKLIPCSKLIASDIVVQSNDLTSRTNDDLMMIFVEYYKYYFDDIDSININFDKLLKLVKIQLRENYPDVYILERNLTGLDEDKNKKYEFIRGML